MQLVIVRHALPERADGDRATADPPLSESGHRQAAATAEFLVGERIDHIVASPLKRARQTAEPLADKLALDIETAEGLREIDPFEGAYVPAEELPHDHDIVNDFAADPFSLFAGAGGFEAFRDTVVGAFDGIAGRNRGRTVAVFCHGTVIGTYLSSLLRTDDPFTLLPDYCGITRVLANTAGWRTIRSVNETAHLRHL